MTFAYRLVAVALLGLASLVPLAAAQVVPKPPTIAAPSYLLIDFASGQVIAEKNADEPVEPASITKMMTAYAVFEELRSGKLTLDETATVSRRARSMPGSRMFVEADSKVTVEALLKGLIVQSGNDASVALAEHVAGSEETFASLMNARGAELGLRATLYTNASGLPDEGHLTTARDIATVASALIRRHPELYQWHKIREFDWNGVKQPNRNRLLWRDESVDGIKTGYTEAAGYCLVASAVRDGMRLISVVMGADSVQARTRQTEALLNYGFRFHESHRVYAANSPVRQARVWFGATKGVDLGVADDLAISVPRGRFADVESQVEVAPNIEAPVAVGSPHGTVKLLLDGEVLATRPLVALHEVPRGGIMRRMTDSVLEFLD